MHVIVEQINTLGKTFVDMALPMLVQSSLLIIVLLVLDRVLRKRIRATVRYWIWMIVLVKMLLPTSLALPTSPFYWFSAPPSDGVSHEPFVLPEPETNALPLATRTAPLMSMANPPPRALAAEPVTPQVSMTWQGGVFLAWMVGVLTMITLLIYRAFFVRRLIEQAEPAGAPLRAILDEARDQMGISSRIALKLSPEALSPAVCGLFRPTIVIPRGLPDELDRQHLQSILLHELAHIRRADLWINSIQAIVQIVYLYHPLLWLANAIIRNIREQAVDEMVLVALGDRAETYSETLLTIANLTFGSGRLSLRMIGVVESQKALYDRIDHITRQSFPSTVKLGIGGLVVVTILGTVLLPMARA